MFRSFSHFLIGLFVFLALSCMSCLYILEMSPLSVVSFAITFSHSEGCLFTLLIVSVAVQKLEMATHPSVLAWRIPGTGGAWWALSGRKESDTTEAT